MADYVYTLNVNFGIHYPAALLEDIDAALKKSEYKDLVNNDDHEIELGGEIIVKSRNGDQDDFKFGRIYIDMEDAASDDFKDPRSMSIDIDPARMLALETQYKTQIAIIDQIFAAIIKYFKSKKLTTYTQMYVGWRATTGAYEDGDDTSDTSGSSSEDSVEPVVAAAAAPKVSKNAAKKAAKKQG